MEQACFNLRVWEGERTAEVSEGDEAGVETDVAVLVVLGAVAGQAGRSLGRVVRQAHHLHRTVLTTGLQCSTSRSR